MWESHLFGKDSTFFFFFKGPVQTTAQLPRFACGVFFYFPAIWPRCQTCSRHDGWSQSVHLRLFYFQLTGGFVLCLLSVCARGSPALVCMRPKWNDKLAERCLLLSVEHVDGRLCWRDILPLGPCKTPTLMEMNMCSN